MSLKAVVGQRKIRPFKTSFKFYRVGNFIFSVFLGIMQDVIRAVQKPGEWKASLAFDDVYVYFFWCDIFAQQF